MNDERTEDRRWSSTGRYALIGFLLIAGYLLVTEHRAHVVAFLPWLLLLACPLLHLFHRHGGHEGSHGEAGADGKPGTSPSDESIQRARHDSH